MKRLVDLLIATVVLIVLVTIAVQAVSPYLPVLGIGLIIVLIGGAGWFTYRLVVRRQAP